MSYHFLPKSLYRMPTHFGPSLGPRQGPEGRRYECRDTPHQHILSLRFRVQPEDVVELLPPGFSLRGEPSLGLEFAEITEIEWLAGRGYNTLGVTLPVDYTAKSGPVQGDLLLVLWENMADPIITGREDLGFAKVYCELSPLYRCDGGVTGLASWDGYRFAELRCRDGQKIDPKELPSSESSGTLHYKYIPATGTAGDADCSYVTLTPAGAPNFRVLKAEVFTEASVLFQPSCWEDLPTLVNIVNRLAAIELGECQGATLLETRGFKDLSDQRRLS